MGLRSVSVSQRRSAEPRVPGGHQGELRVATRGRSSFQNDSFDDSNGDKLWFPFPLKPFSVFSELSR